MSREALRPCRHSSAKRAPDKSRSWHRYCPAPDAGPLLVSGLEDIIRAHGRRVAHFGIRNTHTRLALNPTSLCRWGLPWSPGLSVLYFSFAVDGCKIQWGSRAFNIRASHPPAYAYFPSCYQEITFSPSASGRPCKLNCDACASAKDELSSRLTGNLDLTLLQQGIYGVQEPANELDLLRNAFTPKRPTTHSPCLHLAVNTPIEVSFRTSDPSVQSCFEIPLDYAVPRKVGPAYGGPAKTTAGRYTNGQLPG